MNDKEIIELAEILEEQFSILKLTSSDHQKNYLINSIILDYKAINKRSECHAFDKVLDKASEAKELLSPDDCAIIKLAQFLWIYENLYMECINNLCLLLICNGHDLLNSYSNEYAQTVEQIESINISVKLKFLEAHHITVFKRDEDKKLRNAIAHQHHILDNGKIKLGEKIIDVRRKSEELLFFTTEYSALFITCYDRYYRNLSAETEP